jgi:hypothetical protein
MIEFFYVTSFSNSIKLLLRRTLHRLEQHGAIKPYT